MVISGGTRVRGHCCPTAHRCRLALAAGALLLLSLWSSAAAAGIECEAEVDRTTVPVGGEVVLTVTARSDVNMRPEFELPAIEGVQVYAGGTSQSMSLMNGRTETSLSRTYYLKVNGKEDFSIGPVKIVSAQEKCETDPIAIKVTPAPDAANALPPATTGNRTRRATGKSGTSGKSRGQDGQPGDEVFVTLAVDRDEVWVGQQVVLTFSYWRRVQPWNNPNYTPPRTEGFWRENLGSERNTRRVLQGRAYNVTEIRYALFPTRVGDLVVEPAELNFPRGAFDSFFQSRRDRRRPSLLRTNPVTVHVRALPEPKPANYSGIVASRLKLISQVDRDSIPRGEALGLKAVLTADGFLKGFSDIRFPAPQGVRVHDAGESLDTGVEGDRLTGKLTVEKVLVPDVEGDLQLDPIKLIWFDTNAGKYQTARTATWDVVVTPSDLPLAGDEESGFLRSELSRLGDDLAFVHPVPGSLAYRVHPLTGSWLWWVLVLLPLLLLGAFRWVLSRVAAERRDPAARRSRLALATARETLRHSDEDSGGAIARAVCGYVADCLDQPAAAVGPEEVLTFCGGLGLPSEGQELQAVLAEIDIARYGRSGEGLSSDASAVLAMLAKVDQRRRGAAKSARGATGAVILLALAATLALGTCPLRAQESRGDSTPVVDPLRLIAEANQSYTAGDLQTAEAKYLAARDQGVNDAVLHFNLGNTYARDGKLGQAVASYLRAQRLAPRDKDNRANLAWVRRHIKDLELEERSLPLFVAQLIGVVGWLTLDQWGLVMLVLLWAFCGLIAWGWYRDEFSPGLRRSVLGALAVLVVVLSIVGGRWYSEQVRATAVVVVPEVVVRSGPAANFSALFEVHDGLTLNVAERREGWVRVGLGGDWEGWMPADSIEPVSLSTE